MERKCSGTLSHWYTFILIHVTLPSSELPGHRSSVNRMSSLLSSHGLIPLGNSQKTNRPESETQQTSKARSQTHSHRRQSHLLHSSSPPPPSSSVSGWVPSPGRKSSTSTRISPALRHSPLGTSSYARPSSSANLRSQKPAASLGQVDYKFYPPTPSLPLPISSYEGLLLVCCIV
jgi:hypothetical protein